MDKTNFETIYKKLDNTNSNVNKSEMPTGNLNQTIQLSDTKRSNKKSKIPYDKNNNKRYKKNIRITAKNIEEEDIDKLDNHKTTEIKYNKSRSNQVNSTFNLSNSHLSTNNDNKGNNNKKKINHNKNDSIRRENGRISTQNNDNAKSHRNINNYQRSISKPQNSNPNSNVKKNRYQSVAKTERNMERKKKFLYPSAYEGSQTETTNGKNGNAKFLNNNNKSRINAKNNYYGPIDIKNIVIGNSSTEVCDKLIDILDKNRVKHWKLGTSKFYCNKNGEIFYIEFFILSNKIAIKDNKNKEENETSDFDIHSKNENDDNNDKDKTNNNKTKKIFYITVLSKDSSNQAHAKNINKIINKKFGEIIKK